MKLLLGLVIVCGAHRAEAERAITIDVAAAAPFDADELRQAMRVRLPPDGDPVRVRVTPTATGIQIEAQDRVREVDVAGLHGVAAARLVALAANDLLLDDLATAPVRETPAGLVTISAVGGVAAWDQLLGGAGIDLALPRGRGLIAIELGGGSVVGGPVHLSAATARLGAGLRLGLVELRVGVTLVPVFVSEGVGDSTILAGAGASVRLRVPVAKRVRAVFAVGADAFATRTEYRLDGMTALATPRVAPWLGAGMEVTP